MSATGKPAARVTDIAGHGGVIVVGAPTVLIGGQPAARLGDTFTCPGSDGPKAHVLGNIITASTSVMIDGAFAARLGDVTGCGMAGLSGKGLPAVTAPPPRVTETDHTLEDLSYGENTPYGSRKSAIGLYESKSTDYANGSYKDESKVALIHREGTNIDGDTTSRYEFDGMAMNAELHEGPGGGGGKGKAVGLEGKYERSDKAGDNKLSIEASVGKLEVGAEGLAGEEGTRSGLGGGVTAQGSLFDFAVKAKKTVHVPLTGWDFHVLGWDIGVSSWDLQVAGKVSAGYGVGGSFQAGAYSEDEGKAYSLSQEGMRDVFEMEKLLKKLKPSWSFDWDINELGLRHTPGVGMPGTPGSITTGCFTVLIG